MRPRTALTIVTVLLAGAGVARAHCDTLDGPVVQAARKALETGAPEHALVWVKPEHEAEAREAFRRAVDVRRLNADARALADLYFFETLVRLHREGEGEPYRGLKPAGLPLDPAIAAAEAAIDRGSPAGLTRTLVDLVRRGVRHRLEAVLATRRYRPGDLAAGRRYVEAYVSFVHYVERLHQAAGGSEGPAEHH